MRMLSGVLSVLFVLGVPAWASPSGVEITGFQVRGPAGGNDEFVVPGSYLVLHSFNQLIQICRNSSRFRRCICGICRRF